MAFNGSIQTLYGIENVVFLVFFFNSPQGRRTCLKLNISAVVQFHGYQQYMLNFGSLLQLPSQK